MAVAGGSLDRGGAGVMKRQEWWPCVCREGTLILPEEDNWRLFPISS